MLVLKGIFGGSPKITLQIIEITRKVKNSPKRFLGCFRPSKVLDPFWETPKGVPKLLVYQNLGTEKVPQRNCPVLLNSLVCRSFKGQHD